MADKEFIDPLGRRIFVSSNTNGKGDHPLKHGTNIDAIQKTIETPYRIYGHNAFPNTSHYVRLHSEEYPDPTPKGKKENMNLTVVRFDASNPNQGRAITSYYTDYLSEKPINIKDVQYDENKKHK